MPRFISMPRRREDPEDSRNLVSVFDGITIRERHVGDNFSELSHSTWKSPIVVMKLEEGLLWKCEAEWPLPVEVQGFFTNQAEAYTAIAKFVPH